MRLLLSCVLALLLFTGTAAQALSPAQVRKSYYWCMDFLKWSPAKQVAATRHAEYSLEEVRWACREQKRVGLATLLRNEREYQRCAHGGCQSSSSGSESSARTCISSVQCRGDENCLNGTCQEVNGANHCDAGGLACTSGETCVNGYCK